MLRPCSYIALADEHKLRDRFELIGIPDLGNVDCRPLFCTFCACTQNVSKYPCQLGLFGLKWQGAGKIWRIERCHNKKLNEYRYIS